MKIYPRVVWKDDGVVKSPIYDVVVVLQTLGILKRMASSL